MSKVPATAILIKSHTILTEESAPHNVHALYIIIKPNGYLLLVRKNHTTRAIYAYATKTPKPKLIDKKLTIQPPNLPNTVLKASIVNAVLFRPESHTPATTMQRATIKQTNVLKKVLTMPIKPLCIGSLLPVELKRIAAEPRP